MWRLLEGVWLTQVNPYAKASLFAGAEEARMIIVVKRRGAISAAK
jgi:hypothetical protein